MIHIIFKLLHNLFDLYQVSLSKMAKHWNSFLSDYIMLCGTQIHVAIANKDLLKPPKECDAILYFFLKPLGNANKMVFKPSQIELALIISEMDSKLALEKRKDAYKQIEDSIALHSKLCKLNLGH